MSFFRIFREISDKHFLFGPLGETIDFIHTVRKNGFERIGLLLDQCHVGIMHETLESAVEKSNAIPNFLLSVRIEDDVVGEPASISYPERRTC